jgi:hydrogenase large subunit
LEIQSWDEMMAWVDENESQYESDCGFFIRMALDVGLDTYGGGRGDFIATGTFWEPDQYENPTIEGRNNALISRSGIYHKGTFSEFDHMNVREDTAHSFFEGSGLLHPWDGVTSPIDPANGGDKYSWAKSPRYLVGDEAAALEAGPLARQVIAGKDQTTDWGDHDPLFRSIVESRGPSIFARVMSRMHEAPKYAKYVRDWLSRIDLHDNFYTKPVEHASGKGFGSTEAARGALSDWIVIEDSKIANYQVVTPTAWNIGPRDGDNQKGPMEMSFIGAPIHDPEDPVEMGHVARSFDSCLVCTVHAYDGKTGKELSRFTMGEMG